jgi:hypothetical protein
MRAAAAPVVLATVLMGFGPGMAAGLRVWARPQGQGPAASSQHGWAAGSLCRDCFAVQHWDGTAWQPQDVSVNPRNGYQLLGVAATSPNNAWAVGDYTTDWDGPGPARTWIEHWDGTAWTRQPSPDPGPFGNNRLLLGVAATSPTNAWAVGEYYDMANMCCAGPGHTVIVHWDGRKWAHVPAPNPGGPNRDNSLSAVAATSPDDAWAVGTSGWPVESGLSGANTVIVHWDGTAWTRIPSPSPGSESYLSGVAATSPADAWAVGAFVYTNRAGSSEKTLIEHWDGTAWARIPSPSPGSFSYLTGVTATSPTDAWAVGASSDGTLIEHWDGTAWTPVSVPISRYTLTGVTAISPADAWAVGYSYSSTGAASSLIEHWDGTAWTPVPGPSAAIFSVAAASPNDAWTVGRGQRT